MKASTADDFFARVRAEVPPMFPLSELPRYIPSFRPRYVRKLIIAGKGPRHIKSGGLILLDRDAYLEWLEKRSGGVA